MKLNTKLCLLSSLCLLIMIGCSAQVVLHPIEEVDIIRVEQGSVLTAPKDGYFVSDFYIEEVMKAKVQKSNSLW